MHLRSYCVVAGLRTTNNTQSDDDDDDDEKPCRQLQPRALERNPPWASSSVSHHGETTTLDLIHKTYRAKIYSFCKTQCALNSVVDRVACFD